MGQRLCSFPCWCVKKEKKLSCNSRNKQQRHTDCLWKYCWSSLKDAQLKEYKQGLYGFRDYCCIEFIKNMPALPQLLKWCCWCSYTRSWLDSYSPLYGSTPFPSGWVSHPLGLSFDLSPPDTPPSWPKPWMRLWEFSADPNLSWGFCGRIQGRFGGHHHGNKQGSNYLWWHRGNVLGIFIHAHFQRLYSISFYRENIGCNSLRKGINGL